MSGAESDQSGISQEMTLDKARKSSETAEISRDEMDPQLLSDTNKLSTEIERFSCLSTEMAGFLTRLSEGARKSAEQLSQICSEVDLKKKELKAIYGIEASAEALERLAQDHRQRKESFERLISDQRTLWEAEKAKRVNEEKEYQEKLRIRRQNEDEEYRQKWAGEKLKLQRQLEEELKSIQEEGLKRRQALEKECLDRERILKQKEMEWVQLVQELDQFMAKLTTRAQAQTSGYSESVGKTVKGQTQPHELRSPVSDNGREPVLKPEMARDLLARNTPVWETAFDEKQEVPEVEDVIPRNARLAEVRNVASLQEMLLLKGRRIENLNSEPLQDLALPVTASEEPPHNLE